jgi:multicomponent Na+:H+ antiporter subunit C
MLTAHILIMLLFAVGLYGILSQRNIIKMVISLAIMEYGANIMLVAFGYGRGGRAPIKVPDESVSQFAANAVDPFPQAMVLTSIVIGLGITLLLVAIALRLYQRYGTYDMAEMRKLRG